VDRASAATGGIALQICPKVWYATLVGLHRISTSGMAVPFCL
jgi:hypothetical protein